MKYTDLSPTFTGKTVAGIEHTKSKDNNKKLKKLRINFTDGTYLEFTASGGSGCEHCTPTFDEMTDEHTPDLEVSEGP